MANLRPVKVNINEKKIFIRYSFQRHSRDLFSDCPDTKERKPSEVNS